MAATTQVGSIKRHFRKLRDPRVVGRSRHLLIDIVFIAICAVIGECDNWQEIVVFAQMRQAWFKRFLKLPGGVPSHDTFERVFAKLNPQAFASCCVGWLRDISGLLDLKHVAIDGKTLRGSGNSTLGPLHLVSAWAVDANLSLGQVAVDEKSNEITAIPRLLELLVLKGALVTIDAIGCQKAIAKKITDKGGDYIFTVKANQEQLLHDIQLTVAQGLDGELPAGTVRQYTTVEHGHGRDEERSYVVIDHLDNLRDREAWPKLTMVGMCRSERTINGKTSTEVRYFIGSPRMSARRYAGALRNHWRVENNLHWQLDVSMGEDQNQVEDRTAAANLAMIRKFALSLLKQDPRKGTLKGKRKAAGLDPDFLAEILLNAGKIEEL